MASVITIATLKGGVGKSTIALNLAAALHRSRPTLLVDADPQGTCRAWAARAAETGREGPPTVAVDGRSLRRDLPQITRGFDIAVIDSPPRLGVEARAAMLVADLVLLPTVPGAADLWALRESVDVLEEARQLRPDLRGAILLNRADRTMLTKTAREALDSYGIPVLPTSLGQRVAFGEATLTGLSVLDHAPGSAAAAELTALADQVLSTLGGRPRGSRKKTSRR